MDARAVAPYLAMSVLYKRANPLWRFLIRHRLAARVWRPLVEATRRRHLRFRRKLAEAPSAFPCGCVPTASARPQAEAYSTSAPRSASSWRRTDRWQSASSAQ